MIMLNNLNDIINCPEDIYEYCRYIAKGHYLNMDYFYSKVSGESKHKFEKFVEIMFESLEDEAFEDSQHNCDETEKMKFISLFAYFEEVKKGLLDGKIEDGIMEKYIKDRLTIKSQV